MILVSIESPYASKKTGIFENKQEVKRNIQYARECMADCLKRGEAPIASHLLYTQEGILDDTIPEERKLGIQAGFEWNKHAEKTVVYIDLGVSDGMKAGVEEAKLKGRTVEFRDIYGYSEWR